jgi:hypothetical protein
MLKTLTALCMLAIPAVAIPGAAFAACSAEDAMNKSSEVSDVLSNKLSSNADAASKMMTEMGNIMGSGTVTDQTCTKLDALMVRAKKL